MGTELDETTPGDSDIVADYPANERTNRASIETWARKEHYMETANNDRHKIGVHANDAARDAVVTSPLVGNFSFQVGSAAAANAPRMLALSFYDGAGWHKLYGVPTGTILMAAFDPTTPPEGFLGVFGQAVTRATYPDLFAVIGTAFDQQNGLPAPAGTDFRLPWLGGMSVVGFDATKRGAFDWFDNQNVSDLHDIFATGTYAGAKRTVYSVQITGAGTPDLFSWTNLLSGGSGTGNCATPLLMDNGVTVNFGASTGHAVNDIWFLIADPDIGVVGGSVQGHAGSSSPVQSTTPHFVVLGHIIKT